MAKRLRISGPGTIVNRHAKKKKSKLEIAFDPSPQTFISTAQGARELLKIKIVSEDGDIAPIELLARVKLWVLKLEGANIPPDRLAELEELITEETGVHLTLIYTPQQEELPFEDRDKDEDPSGEKN